MGNLCPRLPGSSGVQSAYSTLPQGGPNHASAPDSGGGGLTESAPATTTTTNTQSWYSGFLGTHKTVEDEDELFYDEEMNTRNSERKEQRIKETFDELKRQTKTKMRELQRELDQSQRHKTTIQARLEELKHEAHAGVTSTQYDAIRRQMCTLVADVHRSDALMQELQLNINMLGDAESSMLRSATKSSMANILDQVSKAVAASHGVSTMEELEEVTGDAKTNAIGQFSRVVMALNQNAKSTHVESQLASENNAELGDLVSSAEMREVDEMLNAKIVHTVPERGRIRPKQEPIELPSVGTGKMKGRPRPLKGRRTKSVLEALDDLPPTPHALPDIAVADKELKEIQFNMV